MSFWDNVKKFAQPYSDEDYDDYDEQMDAFEDDVQEAAPRSGRRPSPFASTLQEEEPAAAPAPSAGFGGQVLNMSSGKQEVVLFHAKTLDDAAKAADELRRSRHSEYGKCRQDRDPPGCGFPVRQRIRTRWQCKESRTGYIPVLPPQYGCGR